MARKGGWVPDQHGAWAMLAVPVLVGAVVSGVTWRHALLLVSWLVAYLAFFAAGLWLRSGRKARYLPPVRAYAVATAALGGSLVLTAPGLLRWAPVYAVLLAVSLVSSVRRTDRGWLNDTVTVLAAMLMTVVAAGLGHDADPGAATLLADGTGVARLVPPGAADPQVWLATGLLTAYFLGTVPYVKTLIRERGKRTVLAVSIGYHAALAVAAAVWAVLAVAPAVTAVAVVAVALLVRAVLVPRRRPWPSAKAVGLGEVAATVAVCAATLALVL
ncbi:YwiC-like family protein [Cellulomonas soli]|uniref:YwiC-like family protein n=1 Tax=Cellulomonas soli TaxID=931535 RepID=UPI003F85A6EC